MGLIRYAERKTGEYRSNDLKEDKVAFAGNGIIN
jgi:hypothetical protein